MVSFARSRSGPARLVALSIVALLAVTLIAGPTAAKPTKPGFTTSQQSMITNLTGGSVKPIITVGDTIGDYMFESIPDGIAVAANGNGTADVFVNHETSTVPFPYSVSSPANNANDMTDSLVSKLKLHQQTAGVLSASIVIGDDENYHRFCSSFLATTEHGFKRSLLLTNEEGTDWVNRTGMQWPTTPYAATSREIGVVVAHDINNGKTKPIWGMGRHNHENSVALKGFGKPIVISGDDTFTTTSAQSQVYSYMADDSDAVWNDTGTLYAFVSDNPAVNDYYDFPANSPMSISGKFVPVPKNIATGRNPNGTDLISSDVGYPAPFGPWAVHPGTTTPVDGPQWVLEHWGDTQPGGGVFQFLRVEDMAYDKRPGMSNVVYLADSGRGLAGAPGPGVSTNGRIWKMVLDPNDPTVVTSLSILIDGDDAPVKTLTEVRQPDNLETTPNGLYITEDPGSSQQFAPGDPAGKNARVWQYKFVGGVLAPVIEVDQSADGGPTDAQPGSIGNMGAWEASGIVDVSSIYGPGSFLLDVQAHSLWIDVEPGPDLANPPAGNDWTYKREGGQLLLVQIPGG